MSCNWMEFTKVSVKQNIKKRLIAFSESQKGHTKVKVK